jgi:hypothetical protein
MDPRPASLSTNTYSSDTSKSVKVATPDLIILTEDVLSPEIMTDLIFEDIGGQEIINISRNDIINGQNSAYQPIKNVASLSYQYNPQNILALQKTDKDYFNNFPIPLYSKVPECGSGYDIVAGQPIGNCKNVYIDGQTGDLVIDLVNMRPGEDIEIQIISRISDLHDTIYQEESFS